MPDHHEAMVYDYLRLEDGAQLRYAVNHPVISPRGTIVVAPGRREFIEKKHIEVGQAFLQAGFRVIIFEWRGQGLSDRLLTGPRRQRDHCEDFAQHVNDFEQFFQKIVKPNRVGTLIFSGHSMGSHLQLRWMAEQAINEVDAAILTAPMLALGSLPVHGLAQAIAWLEVKLGHSEHYATSQHDYDDRDRRFNGNPLCQDEDRYKIMERYFTNHPDMTVGGITWGWLLAALRSLHQLQRPSTLKRITCPVLAITGGRDAVTPAQELVHYLQYIPKAEHIVIDGALHDVMNELESYRNEAWRHINTFLGKISAAKN